MDVWQEHVYKDCAAFVGEKFNHLENEPTISLGQREAYIVMKALEDQQRYLNPMITIPETADEKQNAKISGG